MNSKNIILKIEIGSTILVMIFGVLLHFLYEWSSNNSFVGIFSPVNESVWEHLKLIFYPLVLQIVIAYFYEQKHIENYLYAKTLALIISLCFVVIFYYTYSGIIGTNITFIDISTFFISILLSEYIFYKNVQTEKNTSKYVSLTILSIIFVMFLLFTFVTPTINLFKDPITGTFGI